VCAYHSTVPNTRSATDNNRHQEPTNGAWRGVLLGRKTETIYTVFFDTYKPFSDICHRLPCVAKHIRILYYLFA